MADLSTIIGDVEDAIVAVLQSKIPTLREFNITDNAAMVSPPGVNVGFYNGSVERITDTSFKIVSEFIVTILIQNVKSPRDRRRTVYPFLTAVIFYLAGKKLTLNKDGNVVTLSAKPLTLGTIRKVLDTEARIAYSVSARTSISFEMPDAETAEEFLTLSLQYMLKPGDNTADAEDLVEFGA